MSYTFTKKERLTNKIHLEKIFSDGSSFSIHPFRVVFKELDLKDNIFPAQFAISVPKKRLKLAPHRNKVKRRTREAYRHLKGELYEHLTKNNLQYGIFFIYLDHKILPYDEIKSSMENCIKKLITS
jgi:ribonuclease P protein component